MSDYWSELGKILPEEHRELLALVLLNRLKTGWGHTEIHVKDHHVVEIADTARIPTRRPQKETGSK
jgi:hypothetical protein